MSYCKKLPLFLLAIVMVLLFTDCSVTSRSTSNNTKNRRPAILVFYKTKGFYHTSIPAGLRAFQKLGTDNNFIVDTTNNSNLFTAENLRRYKAVVFLNTTGDVLDNNQQEAFRNYIESGNGYLGVHAAADTEYEWPWYNFLVGAYFLSHPKIQNVTVNVLDQTHVATKMLPAEWKRNDELYNYKSVHPEIQVLARLDEKSYEGGINGENHPFIWYHQVGKGRSFYTGGGHTDKAYEEPLFVQHLLGALQYVMGTTLQ